MNRPGDTIGEGERVNQREHKTMAEAQRECRKLRLEGHGKSVRADEIEAQWRNSSDYESDYAWLTRIQSGAYSARTASSTRAD